MNDCITKPFTQEDLFQVLTKYLGRKLTVKQRNVGKDSQANNTTVVDLSYLKKVSNNNGQFIKEIVASFLESMPHTIEEIEEQLAQKNWEQLARVVHKIKPTITLIGIHHLKDKIVQLEQESKNGQDEVTIRELALEVNQFLSRAIKTLKES
jgi:HPt (histidine-containing phosphotransfer) domain-containing protein